ncbi:hypothetical protein HanIR_Chr10g0483721 [Helianthus annuus]|nr:hypothetical protein HanIR_Chr10g0483721 [Helianthus annuus]
MNWVFCLRLIGGLRIWFLRVCGFWVLGLKARFLSQRNWMKESCWRQRPLMKVLGFFLRLTD